MRHRGDDLVNLSGQRFLNTDQVRVLLADDVEEHLAPPRPVVVAVIGGAVPDVERHHGQRLAGTSRRLLSSASEPPAGDEYDGCEQARDETSSMVCHAASIAAILP